MVQPYNYTIQAPSAFEQLVSGLKLGASVQEMQAAAQQRQMQMEQLRAQQEQQARQRQLMDDVIGGRANRGTWLEIGMMGSSEAQRKGAWDQVANMDQQAVRSQIGFGSQLAFALKKNPAVAKQMLEDALRANPNDEFLKRINQLSETDTDFAAQTALLALPGLGKDGLDAYKETVNRLFPEAAKAAPLSPEAQRKAVADAIQAEADAQIKLANAETQADRNKADLELKRAQAEKARAEAEGRGTPLVQVSTGSKAEEAYATKVASLGAEEDTTLVATARKAPETIQKIDNTLRQIYSSPAITGAFADVIKGIERVRAKFGNQYAEGRVSASEVLDSMLGSEVFPLIGELGIGARGLDTPAEREFLRQVMTGTLSLDRNTIARLAEMRRNRVERSVEEFNNRVDQGELDSFFGARRQKPFRVAIPPRPARPSNMPAPPESAPAGSIQRESPPAQQPLAPAGGPSPIRGLSDEEIRRRLRSQ